MKGFPLDWQMKFSIISTFFLCCWLFAYVAQPMRCGHSRFLFVVPAESRVVVDFLLSPTQHPTFSVHSSGLDSKLAERPVGVFEISLRWID